MIKWISLLAVLIFASCSCDVVKICDCHPGPICTTVYKAYKSDGLAWPENRCICPTKNIICKP